MYLVWVIDINDEDGRHVKNKASIRKIPLHPQLIELGFLNYIDDIKNNFPTEKNIFPYLTPNIYGKLGDSVSKWFARYLYALNIVDSNKVFHSFRSTANNALKTAGISEEIRCEILGHEYDTIDNRYSEVQKVKWLLDHVTPKLTFNKIDLQSLTYIDGSFIPLISKLLKDKLSKSKHEGIKRQLSSLV